ncbi:hypothetical protein AMAG_05562 [Allomyces macrogynus ATCC 38327]|uniref:ABC transporter domain-containing protein n=1 Tax=Allomyces macrogynus (strain ATCC 38327) TaxID=578462 RepID=A0A0L0SCJ1_ALLM3|nr:hypothetical protein AMAG_05562 [Allomyces macrogynus ATCC 38327]|eukprot:KNE60139.1 hypothetical protein AMAG_05562 [Allomyces macrogynus ATCC 38327]
METLLGVAHGRGKSAAAKGATMAALASVVLYGMRRMAVDRRARPKTDNASTPPGADDLAAAFAHIPPAGTKRVGVNREFLRQLKAVLGVCIPGIQTKEVLILALHTIFLLLRTYLSVVVARIDGRIVRDLVAANGKEFLKGIGYWFAIALPATYTNSMIRYLQSKLAIAFRTRLMTYINKLYLDKEQGYYRLLTLDNRIEGPDQYIVTDVARFCDTVSSVYSDVGKPLVDIIIYNVQLARYIGVLGMAGLFVNYMVTARLLRAVTPAFGRMAAAEAKLEGDFRTAHTRLTLNAEEICFYNGEAREKSLLKQAYLRLVKHVNSVYKVKIGYNMAEDFLIKYVWSAVGLGVCAVPVFLPQYSGFQGATRCATCSQRRRPRNHTQAFITNKRHLLSLADAGGRLMYAYKSIAELAGSTSRVYTLLAVLHAMHARKFATDGISDKHALGAIHGQVIIGDAADGLRFENVDVVVPNPTGAAGQELVSGLNLHVAPGQHMMITGANGIGKTSVARVVRGLWPLFEGTLYRPHDKDIFYIPQRPYLVLGTLRDQVIYPDSVEQMRAKGVTDADLMRVLEWVHLAYLPGREGGWDTIKEWKDVCSGGEKQRLNLARLFYHKPVLAFMDECTSAVSTDVEGLMYNRAKELGITLVTISHRPALFRYHQTLLRFKDDGDWEVTQIGTAEEQMSLEKEIASLEERLADLPAHQQRLLEVNRELGIVPK